MKINKPKWSESEIEILQNNYLKESCKKTQSLLPNRTEESIKSKAKRLRILKNWSKNDELLLKSIYSTCNGRDLTRFFPNRSMTAVRAKACRLKLKKKNYFGEIDTRFFDKWTNDMAYVVGFICADGCISIDVENHRYQLIIQINDIELLEKIKRVMNSTTKIQRIVRQCGPIYRLSICSKKLVSQLLKLGIIPRKSKSLKLPNVPSKFLKHFTRGFFDGDGSITLSKFNDRKYINVSFFIGSEIFLEHLRDGISEILNIERKKVFYNNGAFVLRYTHKDAKELLSWMYSEPSIYLERKYMRWKSFLEVAE